MSGVWGNKIKLSIFGESHGKAIGITMDGLEPGISLNLDNIKMEMARRSPGKSNLVTARSEGDEFEILSGFFNGKTTGTPLCAIIYNSNKKSEDYDEIKDLLRPSHADYTGYVKYNGFNDYRGGGHFSGRLTAPLVFAGAVCKESLLDHGIVIGSHIKSISNIEDQGFDFTNIEKEILLGLGQEDFPVINKSIETKMKEIIMKAKEAKDSVGGIIEACAINLPVGLGNPFFDSVESVLSHLLFSIPAVKGVEFGLGFDITKARASEVNDEFFLDGDKIKTKKNNNGGVLGGITNGMPLVFRVAVKPTPSISKLQNTVDINKKENSSIEIKGRHDPCIVQRAVPVVEAVTAIAVLDLLLS